MIKYLFSGCIFILYLFIFADVRAQAPSFTSTPVTTAVENVPYTYGLRAFDGCNDELTFTAPTLPSWLTFSATGQNSSTTFGTTISSPGGVAGDADGNVYVSELNGTSIYKITPDGTTTVWASRNTSNGAYTYGMVVAGDYLYLGYYATQGHITRIALNNPSAGETMVFNSSGSSYSSTGGVLSMVERGGFIYAALYNASAIIKIDLSDPQFTVSPVVTTGLSGPFGLGFAANGDLYIANWTSKSLVKWNGSALTTVLTSADLVNNVSDVKIDKKGFVYISLYGGGIRRYKPDFSSFENVAVGSSAWGMTLTPTEALIYGNNNNQIYRIQTGAALFGTPTHADVGVHSVTVMVSDGDHTVPQSFNIIVSDPNKPAVSAYNPANNAVSIARDANLSLTFNETVKKGTGNITIRNSAGGALLEQIDVTSSRVSIAGATITIDPTADLPAMTTLYLEIDATAILDASDNAYAGIQNSTTWKFQTQKADASLTFATTRAATYGDEDFDPGATSNNTGLAISYTSSDETVASIVAGKVHILKPGTTTLTASQAGDASFHAAVSKTLELTISPKTLTLSLNAAPAISKVYNGTAAATLVADNYALTGVKTGDNVALSGTAAYDSKDAGAGKTVTVSDLVLTGAQKHNYTLTTTTANTTGTISAKQLTLVLNPSPVITKFYDGTAAATLVAGNYTLSGTEANDVLSVSGTATYDTKDAATSKTVTVTNFLLLGAQKDNYTLTTSSAATSGNITQKMLAVTAEDNSRFQGTPNPVLTIRYSGFLNGEDERVLSTVPTASTSANVSSPIGNYLITVSGGVAVNYSFDYIAGTLKVNPGAPDNISLAAALVYENQSAGTKAGVLSSVSGDPNATFTYSLVSGTGSTDNALFTISGNELRTNVALNYEQKANYDILIRSTTQQGFHLDKPFTVSIQDVNEAPTLSEIANQAICFTTAQQTISLNGISAGPESGQTTTLLVNSSNPGLFDQLSISGSRLNYSVKAGQMGSATITVTISDDGGTANGGIDTYGRTFTFLVNPLPVATIISSNNTSEISKGDVLVLTATGGNSYLWDNAAGIVNGQNSANLTVRPEQTTTYRVAVSSSEGCVSYQDITIKVTEDYIMVKGTNILSPNGDGVNDNFIIKNLDMYSNNEVKIFDRAGRLLYSKVNYTDEWTGTFQGSPLADGAYYYIVDFGTGKPKLKGFITIVRD